jgi:transposase
MAYREVTVLEVKEVIRQWLGGAGKKRIAARLGLDVKTVRRYLLAAAEQGLRREQPPADLEAAVAELVSALQAPGRPRSTGWTTCAAERGFIASKLASRVRLSKIHKLLRRRGVHVTYPTLHRFAVAELDFGRGAPTIPVSDGAPGAELQVDTGWVGWLEPDGPGRGRKRFRAWIFTAVLSRHRFVYPVFQETTATAIEACEAAWSFFGGIFQALIFDNTKTVVVQAHPLEPRLNRGFLEYAQTRGFVIDATRVRTPTDKARVERAVRTVSEDCFGGEVLHTIDEARERAVRWSLDEYGAKRQGTTRRLPYEHFVAEEQPVLQQRPAPTERYDVPLWAEPKVHRDQHAQVAKALYSLPRTLLGKTLVARADRSTVRFYHREVLVKTHPRKLPGQRSTDPSDFPADKAAVAARDTAFLVRKASEHGEAVGAYARALLDIPLPWTRIRQVYALLGLARRYGNERLCEACGLALAADLVSVPRLQRMLEVVPPRDAAPKATVVPFARYLRSPKQYALPLAKREANQEGE